MAEIEYTVETVPGGDALYTWSGVTAGDTFQQLTLNRIVSEVSCHISGTPDGATTVIGGGNVSSEMLPLTRIGGEVTDTTVNVIFSVLERPLYIQPVSASGGGAQSITIYMLVRN